MKRSRLSLFSVARWALLMTAFFSLSACSSHVNLNARVNNLEKVAACIGSPGGKCTSDTGTKRLAGGTQPLRIKPSEEVAILKNLILKKPDTTDMRTKEVRSAASDTTASKQAAKAAEFAADALTHDMKVTLQNLFQYANGIQKPKSEKTPNIKLSQDKMNQFAKSVHQATVFDGWTPLRAQLQGHLDVKRNMKSTSPDDKEIEVLENSIKQLDLIKVYLSAYFSNGKFVSIVIDPSNMKASAVKNIKENIKNQNGTNISEDQVNKLVLDMMNAIVGMKPGDDGKYHLLTKTSDGGFVTRGGAKYVFPGVSITVDPFSDNLLQVGKIDFTQVGADVVRVVLEALGDAWGQLPADQTSTACKAITDRPNQYKEIFPEFKCYNEEESIVKPAQFAEVNNYANLSESLAATATGEVIRGGAWISLNNEALAKLIETAVGVVARKAAEKVSWCVYACKQNEKAVATKFLVTKDQQASAKAESDAAAIIDRGNDIQTIELSIGR